MEVRIDPASTGAVQAGHVGALGDLIEEIWWRRVARVHALLAQHLADDRPDVAEDGPPEKLTLPLLGWAVFSDMPSEPFFHPFFWSSSAPLAGLNSLVLYFSSSGLAASK